MNTGPAIAVSVALLAGNAFFVAAEFALVASQRHRLAAAAPHSRAARAALHGVDRLSMMLAGAQLGITLCSLGLGALAEPALAHLIAPAFAGLGLSPEVGHVVAFVLAMAVVVFSHMVIGEMAPKSWAIIDPERSAMLLALPFRAFTTATRPMLAALNLLANLALRVVKVAPQDTLAHSHGPEELRLLLAQSYEHGLLPADQHHLLTRLLTLQTTTVEQVMTPRGHIVTVRADADAATVETTSRASGRSRLVVTDPDGVVIGLVHLRDVVRGTTTGRRLTAGEVAIPALFLPVGTTVADAITTMREHRAQLALVTATPGPGSGPGESGQTESGQTESGQTESGQVVGLAALEDLLEQVLGNFEDETDPATTPSTRRPTH